MCQKDRQTEDDLTNQTTVRVSPAAILAGHNNKQAVAGYKMYIMLGISPIKYLSIPSKRS